MSMKIDEQSGMLNHLGHTNNAEKRRHIPETRFVQKLEIKKREITPSNKTRDEILTDATASTSRRNMSLLCCDPLCGTDIFCLFVCRLLCNRRAYKRNIKNPAVDHYRRKPVTFIMPTLIVIVGYERLSGASLPATRSSLFSSMSNALYEPR